MTLLKDRTEAILRFLSLIDIPVTTKECIDYLETQECRFTSDILASKVAAVSVILKTLSKENSIAPPFKVPGTRDLVWSSLTTNEEKALYGTPMRVFIDNNFDKLKDKGTSWIMKRMISECPETKKFIETIGHRKNTLAMIRGDLIRASFYRNTRVEDTQRDIGDEYEITA